MAGEPTTTDLEFINRLHEETARLASDREARAEVAGAAVAELVTDFQGSKGVQPEQIRSLAEAAPEPQQSNVVDLGAAREERAAEAEAYIEAATTVQGGPLRVSTELFVELSRYRHHVA